MDIVLFFLVFAVVIAILMHLHFRNARDVRVALVSPPVFAIAGALIGIAVGMLWFRDEERRVFLEKGFLHALLGGAAGGLVGMGAQAVLARSGRPKAVVVVLTLMLLAASVGAPLGWLYGDFFRVGLPDDAQEAKRWTRNEILWGSAIGCCVGLALGLFEVCFGSRPPKGDAVAPDAENAVS